MSCVTEAEDRSSTGFGIDAEQDRQDHERGQHDDLAPANIGDVEEARLLQLAENHLAVEPQHVGGRQNRAERRQRRHPIVDPERSDQRQELADKSGGPRQPNIGQREDHEHESVERHAIDEAAIGRDLTRMHAVVDDADAQKQGGRDDAVGDHLKDAAGRHPVPSRRRFPW